MKVLVAGDPLQLHLFLHWSSALMGMEVKKIWPTSHSHWRLWLALFYFSSESLGFSSLTTDFEIKYSHAFSPLQRSNQLNSKGDSHLYFLPFSQKPFVAHQHLVQQKIARTLLALPSQILEFLYLSFKRSIKRSHMGFIKTSLQYTTHGFKRHGWRTINIAVSFRGYISCSHFSRPGGDSADRAFNSWSCGCNCLVGFTIWFCRSVGVKVIWSCSPIGLCV